MNLGNVSAVWFKELQAELLILAKIVPLENPINNWTNKNKKTLNEGKKAMGSELWEEFWEGLWDLRVGEFPVFLFWFLYILEEAQQKLPTRNCQHAKVEKLQEKPVSFTQTTRKTMVYKNKKITHTPTVTSEGQRAGSWFLPSPTFLFVKTRSSVLDFLQDWIRGWCFMSCLVKQAARLLCSKANSRLSLHLPGSSKT